MAIIYNKLFTLLKEHGITTYQIRQTKLISANTWKLMKSQTGGPGYDVLNRLCETLGCQPGDLMEYVPDEQLPVQQDTH